MSMKIEEELLDIEGIKTSNKSLLELFIRRTAVITSTPESLVEKIIKDQWSRANRATQQTSDISEIDFCNLGTFYLSPSKARKRIKHLEQMSAKIARNEPSTDDRVNLKRTVIIADNENRIKAIKFKTKQLETNV